MNDVPSLLVYVSFIINLFTADDDTLLLFHVSSDYDQTTIYAPSHHVSYALQTVQLSVLCANLCQKLSNQNAHPSGKFDGCQRIVGIY